MAIIYGTTGSDRRNGTQGNDTIYGWARGGNASSPSGNDALNGLAGNDTLYGGDGNDTVDGGDGNDYLDSGYGNDTLYGRDGNDTLYGRDGSDTLTGGPGADTFRFSSPFEGIDNITDFVVADDTISVAGAYFSSGLTPDAAITPEQFIIGSVAGDANDRFIYNQINGALFFDADGTGASEQVQLASLSTGLAMTNNDIFVRD